MLLLFLLLLLLLFLLFVFLSLLLLMMILSFWNRSGPLYIAPVSCAKEVGRESRQPGRPARFEAGGNAFVAQRACEGGGEINRSRVKSNTHTHLSSFFSYVSCGVLVNALCACVCVDTRTAAESAMRASLCINATTIAERAEWAAKPSISWANALSSSGFLYPAPTAWWGTRCNRPQMPLSINILKFVEEFCESESEKMFKKEDRPDSSSVFWPVAASSGICPRSIAVGLVEEVAPQQGVCLHEVLTRLLCLL